MARTLKVSDNGAGHNSGVIDAAALKRRVERVANLMREQKALGEDIKEEVAAGDEAGEASKKELRRLARESLMDAEVLEAQLDHMAKLRQALGSFAALPLGEAAVKEASNPKRGRKDKTEEALDAAKAHLSGEPVNGGWTLSSPRAFEDDLGEPTGAA